MNSLTDASIGWGAVANELVDSRLCAGETIHFTVSTSSMCPTLLPGDGVIVRAAHPETLRLGDILVRMAGDAWLTHRLIGCRGARAARLLLTKGDNCSSADEAWLPTQLTGVVETVERGGRRYALRGKARVAAAVVALLSRVQWRTSRARPDLLRRALVRGSGALIRIAASFALWMAG